MLTLENNSFEYDQIASLVISSEVVPRLGKTLHKECFIDTRDGKEVFIVQVPTDDNNPRGTILMFYPKANQNQEGEQNPEEQTSENSPSLADLIPEGYAICDGDNGTPDLRGRFIKATSDYDDIGKHDVKDETNSIKIKEENLPNHTHQFTITNNSSIKDHQSFTKDNYELMKVKIDDENGKRIVYYPLPDKPLTHDFNIDITIEQDSNSKLINVKFRAHLKVTQ